MSTELDSPRPWTEPSDKEVPAAPETSRLLVEVLVVGSWAMALAAVLAAPTWLDSAHAGDDLTRHTVRLALVYYAAALILMMYSGPLDRLARWCWTLAWATYLVHLAMAFHHYHHWSHGDAVRHTREVSGLGEGIWVSYAFTLAWSLDVAAWWLAPLRRARRSPWVDRLLQGFMLFVVFNATVVYETGLIRWAGAVGLGVLGLLRWRRGRWGRRTPP
jgi:hypothetical protein